MLIFITEENKVNKHMKCLMEIGLKEIKPKIVKGAIYSDNQNNQKLLNGILQRYIKKRYIIIDSYF